ncbi:hypothetical protein BB427_16300 [Pseudoalteromonas sp. BMB]|uniref:hybrid non-ribosomal peptide synthetase/type I polyketide synthase n=1 Tax=Pseudoalteromonas sp. BMB TaxID=1874619 RepID=UPI00083DAF3F|nr:hybrid non-ribosomal peptide synthetase/type I polyketide synthase [Pseudoalteromonas sp. BMB]ODB35868.1 hypothetical protein BB427_16300 [Pseudoalteromonas sp. BMB]
MDISKIFEQCVEQGVELNCIDGDLEVLFNEPPTEDLISILRANKPQIIAFLEEQTLSDSSSASEIENVDRSGSKFQLSFSQQRLWFIDTLDGQSAQYNMPSTVRVNGRFSISAAEQAMQYLIERHEILRTVYQEEDGKAFQVIKKNVQFRLNQYDLVHYPHTDKQEKVKELIAEESERAFNLAEDLMVRASYIELSQDHGVLVFNMHHIATDGWSMSVLVKEFAQCYSDIISGIQPRLAPLAIQYLDYAYWQRDWLQGDNFSEQMSYWQQNLADAPLVHSLPLDYTRPPVKQHIGNRISKTLSADTAQLLQQLATDHQLTHFMLLHGALSLVLARHSNSQDILVGTPVSNRKRVEFESLIGFFANTMVLRVNTDFDSLHSYLDHVRQVHLDAQSNQDIPFEQLVDKLNVPRSRAYNPIVQILLATNNSFALDESLSSDELVLGDVKLSPIAQTDINLKFDLEVNTLVSEQGIEVAIDYDISIFDQSSVEQIAQHLCTLLEAFASASKHKQYDLPLSSYAMMTTEEQSKLSLGGDALWCDFPHDTCLHELFEAKVVANPEKIAVVFDGQSLTYGALNDKANQVARYLQAHHNVKPDTPVGLCLQRSLEMVVGMLAILKAGGAYVPLEPSYPKSRMDYLLSDTGIQVVLTHEPTASLLAGEHCELLNLSEDLCHDFSTDNINSVDLGLSAQNLAYIIYTSGSTGNPKGVMIEHRSVVNRISWMENQYQLKESDVILQKTPFSFDVSVWEFFWPLITGNRLVMAQPEGHKNPEYLQKIIQQESVSIIHFVPSMLRSMLEVSNLTDCTSLRHVFCSGEALTADIIKSFFAEAEHAELHNLYGPTEAAIDVSSWNCNEYDDKSGLVPIGKAIQNTRLYVLDEKQNLLPQGAVGELYIGGVAVGRGYFNNPKRTAENFLSDPFSTEPEAKLYKTGDLVRYLSDGNIAYLGRSDDQVKVNGFRIELGEIEYHINQCPEVDSAFVLQKSLSAGQKKLVGYIKVASNNTDSAAVISSIKQSLKKTLPEFMVPAHFVCVKEWPLSANGKIEKSKLPDVSEHSQGGASYIAPQSAIEVKLSQVWSSLLNVERVSMQDNFFDLGGDSILSIQAVARSRALGVYFTVAQQFENQTLAELARVVTVEPKVEVPQVPCSGEMQLLPIQSSFFAQKLHNPDHFNQAVLLQVPASIDTAFWYQLVQAVYNRHDALRLIFKESQGNWSAQFQAYDESMLNQCVELHDFSQYSDTQRQEELEKQCALAQKSLAVQQGVLFKLCYFNYGPQRSGRLLIVCHHLVIDGVSWRVLMKDLEQAAQLYANNEPLKLDPKTSSLQTWQKKLTQYANSESLLLEKPYWLKQLQSSSEQPAPEFLETLPQGVTSSSKMVLSVASTQAFLRQCNPRFKTHINESLLACLLRAWHQWTNLPTMPLSVESHGREPLFNDVDITETLGWFTTVYPLVLSSEIKGDFVSLLQSVKMACRETPNNGIGYGVLWALAKEPEIMSLHHQTYHQNVLFNYQGNSESATNVEQGFSVAKEGAGATQCELNQLSHMLHADGAVIDGQLTFSFTSQCIEQRRLDSLSELFLSCLNEAVDYCKPSNDGFVAPLVPQDFPNSRLSQSDLCEIRAVHPVIDRLYVSTPLQRGMLYHSLLDKSGTQYTTVSHFDFSGQLHINHFKQALQIAIERHDILRTCFVGLDLDLPHQLVTSHVNTPFEVKDWRNRQDGDINAALAEFKEQEKAKGIDYSHAPLMRFALILLPNQRYQFVWVYHHLLLDGWCLPVLLNEVMSHYQALVQNPDIELSMGEVVPYENFVNWYLKQDQDAAKAYWQAQLKGLTTATKLVDKPANAVSNEYGQVQQVMSEDLQLKLAHIAKQNHCTVNVIMQFAWSYVLAKYNGTHDVVIGTTVSGRPAELDGIEKILGMFINTIPTRTIFDEQQTIGDALQSRHAKNVAAEAFSYLSLAEVQQLSDLPPGSELFNTLFVFENYPSVLSQGTEHGETSLNIENSGAVEHSNYPLTVIVTDQEYITLTLDYQKSHFNEQTMTQIMEYYCNVLSSIASVGSAAQVTDITMQSELELQSIFKQLQGPKIALPNDKCIHELFEEQASKQPHKVAVEFGNELLTYEQLNSQANQVAHYLLEEVGAQFDENSHNHLSIGVCFERSLDMLVTIIGILKAGFHYVPLDPEYPANRLELISHNANMFKVLTCGNVSEKLASLDCDIAVFSKLALESYPSNNIPVDQAGINSHSIAYSIYTSGSTGVPKGVALRHRNAVAMLSGAHVEYSQEELSRVLFSTSLNFDLSIFEMFLPLCFGSQLVLVKSILSLLDQDVQVSLVATVPSAIKTLLEVDGIPKGVKAITLGGEALGANVVNGLLDNGHCNKVVNIYGPTEDTTYSTSAAYTSHTDIAPNIGNVVPNSQGYILSSTLTPVPFGAIGELYMSGAGVTAGYVNSEELTEKRFIKNPFYNDSMDDCYQVMYKTGDLVKMLPDGALAFVCREDEQVKVNGVRIELGEIEHVLSSVNGIDSAVVIAKRLDEADSVNNQIVAYFKPEKEALSIGAEKALVNEAKTILASALPSTMQPNRLVLVKDWPLNPNGKIDKSQLSKQDSVQSEAQLPQVDRVESKLIDIWKDLLQLNDLGVDEGFFDVGGNSLTIVSMVNRVNKQFNVSIQLTDAFTHPTVSALASYLRTLTEPTQLDTELSHSASPSQSLDKGEPIAIIGMAGQFPDAEDVAEFWHNIETGRESLETYTKDQLLQAGFSEEDINDPWFVGKGVTHKYVKEFDADYFGFTPKQAEIMDPQQRMLFESTQHALDDAGYGNTDIPQNIGVFVGCSDSQYLFNNLLLNRTLMAAMYKEISQANSNTYSASRLAYKFNLTGPAISIATACSTSLVAIHQAVTSIQNGDCQMALAGGASIANLGPTGYHYQEGNIASQDGHCRAFDDNASGTRSGNGVGMLLLKPLSKAIKDGDNVHAVIRGTAVNNDGRDKIGFTAPSVAGQSEVVATAMKKAGVTPEQVQYIETHGTGTRLGDPIEIRGLRNIFQSAAKNSIALGTLKPNIGHTDIAAGVAGVIKAVLAIKAKKMPKSINFDNANIEADLDNTPFYINTQTKYWPESNETRIAGISSFGIGGTNAHSIIEQAPERHSLDTEQAVQLLVLSASSAKSLTRMNAELAKYLDSEPQVNLSDVAFTLQKGRKQLPFRQYHVAATRQQAVEVLKGAHNTDTVKMQHKKTDVYFMFSGQGTQYEQMAKDLYHAEPVFRDAMNLCANLIKVHSSVDILQHIYPEQLVQDEQIELSIHDTIVTQPALFAVEYSLAKTLMSWGIQPAGAIGHSLGEYVAATVAGVFSLENALKLVCKRAQIMHQVQSGAMLSVVLNEEKAQALADKFGCDVAAVNAPQRTVIAGEIDAIDELIGYLQNNDIIHNKLHTSHAFHSRMMIPVVDEFKAIVSGVEIHSPQFPIISNVTGEYLTNDMLNDGDYWVNHLRGTVRFSDGLSTLLASDAKINRICVEIGPGNVLSKLGQLNGNGQSGVFLSSLKGAQSSQDDIEVLRTLQGALWAHGVNISWDKLSSGEEKRRVSLPKYPFERKEYWVEPVAESLDKVDLLQAADSVQQWLYEPVWNACVRQSSRQRKPNDASSSSRSCLVFEDKAGMGRLIGERLKEQNIAPIFVEFGDTYQRICATRYQLDALDKGSYSQLATDLAQENLVPSYIVHGTGIDDAHISDASQSSLQVNRALSSLLIMCQAFEENEWQQEIKLTVLTTNAQRFDEDDTVIPEKSALLGVCRVIPAEYRNIDFQSVDIEQGQSPQLISNRAVNKLVSCITAEAKVAHRSLCLRGNQLWHQSYARTQNDGEHASTLLKSNGVYVVSGGLSGIGAALAEHIAKSVTAKLVLLGRSEFPSRQTWNEWIAANGSHDQTSQTIIRIREMEKAGSEVLILQADITQNSGVTYVKKRVAEAFGKADGIIHSAGVPGGGLMSLKTQELIEKVLKPKVAGTMLLASTFEDDQLDFFINCSSLAPIIGGIGQFEYCAANAYQDAFSIAREHGNTQFISINWDSWSEVGMAVKEVNSTSKSETPIVHLKNAMTPEQGKQVFDRILRNPRSQVIVSRTEINARVAHLEVLMKTQDVDVTELRERKAHDRPDLSVEFVEPKFNLELELAEIWRSVLGIERVGINDNLFDLGGDSLLLSGIITRINKKWDVRFPLKTAYEKPTIKEMAESLATHTSLVSDIDSDDCEYEEEVL